MKELIKTSCIKLVEWSVACLGYTRSGASITAMFASQYNSESRIKILIFQIKNIP